LKTIKIPKSVTIIGENAFAQCTGLTMIILPAKLSRGSGTIGNEAFEHCSELKEIQIPEGVTSIGVRAFASCEKLSGIILPETLLKIGEEAFCKCISLNGIRIPPKIKTIPRLAFTFCEGLEWVTFPESLKIIEEMAFGNCGLRSIELRCSIQEIVYGAFAGTILKEVRLIEGSSFGNLINAFDLLFCHRNTKFLIAYSKNDICNRKRSEAVLTSIGKVTKQRNQADEIFWA
jgi:hypothetical protein